MIILLNQKIICTYRVFCTSFLWLGVSTVGLYYTVRWRRHPMAKNDFHSLLGLFAKSELQSEITKVMTYKNTLSNQRTLGIFSDKLIKY